MIAVPSIENRLLFKQYATMNFLEMFFHLVLGKRRARLYSASRFGDIRTNGSFTFEFYTNVRSKRRYLKSFATLVKIHSKNTAKCAGGKQEIKGMQFSVIFIRGFRQKSVKIPSILHHVEKL